MQKITSGLEFEIADFHDVSLRALNVSPGVFIRSRGLSLEKCNRTVLKCGMKCSAALKDIFFIFNLHFSHFLYFPVRWGFSVNAYRRDALTGIRVHDSFFSADPS